MSGTLQASVVKDEASATNNLTLNTSGGVTVGQNLAVTWTITGSSTVAGATGILYPLVSGTAQASTSGTNIDFTGIPSWVKRITVMFNGVSTNGTSNPQIQLGTGATPTYTTTGYQNQSANVTTSAAGASANATTGFVFSSSNASNTLTGSLVFTNITGNTWVGNGSMFFSATAMGTTVGGIALGAVLTAVRITTVNGTDTSPQKIAL